MERWRTRSTVGPIVLTAGALLTLIASFFDWVRSGQVSRSSYETLGLIERLGFAPDGPVRAVIRLWPLMPLLLAIAVVAAWWGQRIVACVFGVVAGLYAATLGFVVAAAVPDSQQIGVSAAPLLTGIGGATVVVGSLLCVVLRVPSAHAQSR